MNKNLKINQEPLWDMIQWEYHQQSLGVYPEMGSLIPLITFLIGNIIFLAIKFFGYHFLKRNPYPERLLGNTTNFPNLVLILGNKCLVDQKRV